MLLCQEKIFSVNQNMITESLYHYIIIFDGIVAYEN